MKCRRSNSSRGSRLRGPANRTVAENPARGAHFSPSPPVTSAPVSAMPDSASVLYIDGHTEGSIQYAGTVSVGPHGAVVGDIHATAVIVEGAVKGHIHAAQTLRIAGSATIVGDMHSPRVAVVRGAQLRGNIRMRTAPMPPSDLDEPAVDTLLSGGRRA